MNAVTLSRALWHAIFIVSGVAGLLSPAQAQPDRKVTVGGYALHIHEAGSGTSAVVFESGLGEDVSTWQDVQPEVAKFARTFSYDRAGIGQSDASLSPRTKASMAADLHSLLRAAKVPPPYILVGHSLGGALVQAFARAYPADVAGLVLVDPEDGRLLERLHTRLTPAEWTARQKALDEAMPKMPAAVQAEMKAGLQNGRGKDEVLPLPKVPVILITGTKKNPEFPGNPLEQDLKLGLHNELQAKTPGSKHVLAPNSRHYIQNDAPQLVVDAIREVVNRSTASAGSVPRRK
jgi:pimeloyl-ACP methyl ester carboxylesterase